MKKRISTAILAALSVAVIVAGAAARADEGMIVTDPYAFAVPSGTGNGAAFLTLTYPPATDGAVPDRLVRAESPVAARVELHTMLIEGDVMRMRRMENMPLPPTGKFAMTPHGAHIMLIDLNRPLIAGEDFPLTLVFEKSGSVDVTVPVRIAGDAPAADHDHDHSSHDHDHGHDH